MRRTRNLLAAALAVILTATSPAQLAPPTTEKRPISLEEAIQMALQNNLDLQIERFNPQLSLLDVAVSEAYWEPTFNLNAQRNYSRSEGEFNPTINLVLPARESTGDNLGTSLVGATPFGLGYDAGMTIGRNFRHNGTESEYRSGADITLRQKLLRDGLFYNSYRYAIDLSKKNLEISEYVLQQRVMEVITAVENAYYNLIASEQFVGVQQSALQLAERSFQENRTRVQVGTMARLDEKQAEALVASSKADLLQAYQQLSVAQNSFKDLITAEYETLANVTFSPTEKLLPTVIPFDLQESWRRAVTGRPELLQARAGIERSDINLKFQKNQLLPTLDLVGSYGHSGRDMSSRGVMVDISRGNNPSYYYGAQMSIPVGNAAARNRYQATRAEKDQALTRFKRLEQSILVDVDNAVKLAQLQFEKIEATRQARLYAEAALDAEQKKLESGKSTSFVVLTLQRDLTRARSEEIRALADYNIALSQLALREATTLERNRLHFKKD